MQPRRRGLFLFLAAGLLVTLAAAAADEAAAPKAVRLKVMTYNIRIGAGGGAQFAPPEKISLEGVARVMAAQQPDLVGVQEVDQHRKRSAGMDQPEGLSQRLKMKVAFVPAYTVPSNGGPEEQYGVALLSRFALQPCERIPLFKPDYTKHEPRYPDYFSEQRALLHTSMFLGGRQVHVFVTHLGLTADQRAEQLKQIAEAAARHPGPKLLMGDFNAEPGEPAMALLEASFKDVLDAVGTPAEKRRSFPAGTKPRGSIDHIFVSPEFRVLSAQVVLDTSLASDHNPVIAELELPAAR